MNAKSLLSDAGRLVRSGSSLRALLAAGMFCSTVVFAQDDVQGVGARYPAGAITSVETADRALAEAASERAAVEARFAQDEHACYSRFFANSCREKAAERRRAALERVQPVEVEANAYKRRAKVAERDKALEEKRAQEEREQPERLQRQREEEARRAEASAKRESLADVPAPVESGAGERVLEHEAKLKRLQAQQAAEARKRAQNIAEYEKKVQAAEKRQREVAERKARKERERELKRN